MKKANIKKNFIYNMCYEVLILAVPLITTPYVSRVLGAENTGIYNLVTANVTYFTLLASFGSASYAQREIAFNYENRKILTNEFWGIFILRLFATIIALLCFGVFCVFNAQYSLFYLISGISIISIAADVSWFFQGIENFRVTVVRNIIIKIIATIFIFVFVKDVEDLWLYIAFNVGAVLIGNGSLWCFLKGYIGKISWFDINLKKHFIGSLKLFIPVLAIQVYTVLDKTMLGALIDVAEVGYYSQAEKIVKLVITVINALAVVLLPRISVLVAENNYIEANRYYKKSVKFASLLGMPCMMGCILVAEDFVPWFLGEDFIPSISILQILSALFVVLGLARVIGSPLLIPLKRENKYTFAVMSGALINVCLNLLMIPSYGAKGATFATIVAEYCVTLLEIFFVRDKFKPQVVFQSILTYLVPTVLMTAVLVVIQQIMDPGILRMSVLVICGGTTYLSYLLIRKDELVYDNIVNPIKRKINIKYK